MTKIYLKVFPIIRIQPIQRIPPPALLKTIVLTLKKGMHDFHEFKKIFGTIDVLHLESLFEDYL
jgi:hypothetical protein